MHEPVPGSFKRGPFAVRRDPFGMPPHEKGILVVILPLNNRGPDDFLPAHSSGHKTFANCREVRAVWQLTCDHPSILIRLSPTVEPSGTVP